MNLLSLGFLVFFAGLLLAYYLVPRGMQWPLLLGASLVFYLLSAKPYTIVYLFISVAVAFRAGGYIDKAGQEIREKEKKGWDAACLRKKQKQAFIAAVSVNLALLAVLKYTNSLLGNLQSVFNLLGMNIQLGTVGWVASLGISFYTLQVVGYLADVYWGISRAQPNIFKLLLFTAYFPQIISGPISRYGQLEEQLYAQHRFDYCAVAFGAQRIMWGFFKKLVIAERIAPVVQAVYTPGAGQEGFLVTGATLLAAFQIYTDFSGNMDIVLGVSECFGIRLAENFNTPFFSRTLQEFWQRWHITLGSWLKDYVMFPLLKSRAFGRLGKWLKAHWGKKVAKLLPPMLAMLLLWLVNGVWHGAAWKYMAVVLWFWLAVAAGQVLAPVTGWLTRTLRINTESFSWHAFQSLRTLGAYAIGVLFFTAKGVGHALALLKSAVTVFNPQMLFTYEFQALFNTDNDMYIMLAGLVVLFFAEAYMQGGRSLRGWVAAQNLPFRWALYYVLLFVILIFGIYGPGYSAAEFIYAGF